MTSRKDDTTSDQSELESFSSGSARVIGLTTLDLVQSTERNAGFSGQGVQVSEAVATDCELDLLNDRHAKILPVIGNICNQLLRISGTGNLSENPSMEKDKNYPVSEWRRRNLQRIIDENYEGVSRRFAEHYALAASNASQLISGSRAFGNDLARRFEAGEALRPGWIDEEIPLTDSALSLARRFMEMSPENQAKMLSRLEELTFIERAMQNAEEIKQSDSGAQSA